MNIKFFCILDTETTGLDPLKDAIVEIAILLLNDEQPDEMYKRLINPERPIPEAAQAVHHITDEMVKEERSLIERREEFQITTRGRIIACHHAPFDRAFCAPMQLTNDWLCTCRLARHLWPDAPSHGNQQLREWLDLKVDTGGEPAHRAGADAIVTAALLRAEIAEFEKRFPEATYMELQAFAAAPIIYKRMPFGKHRGVALADVPSDYIAWALENMQNLDVDLKDSMLATHPNLAK